MTTTIRARFKSGVLEPLEKIDLPEGKEVTVTIEREPTEDDIAAFRRSAGSWTGTMPDAKTLIRRIYTARRAGTRRLKARL